MKVRRWQPGSSHRLTLAEKPPDPPLSPWLRDESDPRPTYDLSADRTLRRGGGEGGEGRSDMEICRVFGRMGKKTSFGFCCLLLMAMLVLVSLWSFPSFFFSVFFFSFTSCFFFCLWIFSSFFFSHYSFFSIFLLIFSFSFSFLIFWRSNFDRCFRECIGIGIGIVFTEVKRRLRFEKQ